MSVAVSFNPHWVAGVVGFVVLFLLCSVVAKFFLRRIEAWLVLLGLALTIMIAAQGQITASAMEGTGLLGIVLTAVLVAVFGVARYSWRRNRALRYALGRRGGHPRPLRFQEEVPPRRIRAQGRLQEQEWEDEDDAWEQEQLARMTTVPVPQPYDEVEREVDYQRPAQRHSSRSRARGGYVVEQHPARRLDGAAQGARLQQGEQSARPRRRRA